MEENWFRSFQESRVDDERTEARDLRRFQLLKLLTAAERALVQPIQFAQEALENLYELSQDDNHADEPINVLEIRDDLEEWTYDFPENVLRLTRSTVVGQTVEAPGQHESNSDARVINLLNLQQDADYLQALLRELRELIQA